MDLSRASFKAMRNDLILLEILSNLNASDLKTFRLVSRRWNTLVTSTLLRRNLLHIQIDHYAGQNTFFIDNGQESFHASFSLRHLAVRMSNSARFPCRSFTIKGMPSPLTQDSLQGFLETYGATFKSLRLMSVTSCSDLKFILENTPNLENLSIFYLNVNHGHLEAICPKLKTSLKSLRLSFVKESPENHKVFKYLLASSPKLTRINDFQIEHLKFLREARKLHLIRALKFTPDLDTLKLYQEFATLPIFLAELNISMMFSFAEISPQFVDNVGAALSRILSFSATSLKKLTMLPLSGWPVKFPVLPNLRSICFNENDEYIREYTPPFRRANLEQVFPPGFDFHKHFPNVATISFAGIGDRDIALFFPRAQPQSHNQPDAIRTENLKILTRIAPGEICFLSSKLHLMTSLELRNTFLDTYQVNLWAFLPETLKRLQLYDTSFSVLLPPNRNQGWLDYYFTRIIENDSTKRAPQTRVFQLRNTEEASFMNMRGLRFMDFTFEQIDFYLSKVWFTPLTGRYAFEGMKDLAVTFLYDKTVENAKYMEKNLKPMSKYVTFSHFNRRMANEDFHY